MAKYANKVSINDCFCPSRDTPKAILMADYREKMLDKKRRRDAWHRSFRPRGVYVPNHTRQREIDRNLRRAA